MTFLATEKSLLFVARSSWSCNLSFSLYVASVRRQSSTNCMCFWREISSSLLTITKASLVVMTMRSRMACDRSLPSLTSSMKAMPPCLWKIGNQYVTFLLMIMKLPLTARDKLVVATGVTFRIPTFPDFSLTKYPSPWRKKYNNVKLEATFSVNLLPSFLLVHLDG